MLFGGVLAVEDMKRSVQVYQPSLKSPIFTLTPIKIYNLYQRNQS